MLRGRKPYPWGESVRLSRGAVGRLLQGKFPDPVMLVPMLRIERLSLSWLLDGAGTPYLVLAPAHDIEAAQELVARLADEPSWQILLAHCDEGFCVVLHQPAVSTDSEGREYPYVATEVIGGGACGPEVMQLVLGQDRAARRLTQLELPPHDWRRLVSGFMGNTELWGWEREPVGLATPAARLQATALPAQQLATRYAVADTRVEYRTTDEHEVLRIIRGCKPCERETILRMVRAMG